METNKIEKALLDKELKVISEKLQKIGSDIKSVFNKYGLIKGQHAEEMQEYVVSKVLSIGENYFAGYTTEPRPQTHPDNIPECMKKLVLEWAVEDFFDHFDHVSDIVDNIDQ